MIYPPDWPRCPVCNDFALDGHSTCGRLECNEREQRDRRCREYAAREALRAGNWIIRCLDPEGQTVHAILAPAGASPQVGYSPQKDLATRFADPRASHQEAATVPSVMRPRVMPEAEDDSAHQP